MGGNADCNIDLILKIAGYVARVPYGSATLVKKAGVASEAKMECPVLGEIAEPPILKTGGDDVLLRLAEKTIQAENEDDIAKIKEEIQGLKEKAEFKSVEEALGDIK